MIYCNKSEESDIQQEHSAIAKFECIEVNKYVKTMQYEVSTWKRL
jgi:hypothetical protein